MTISRRGFLTGSTAALAALTIRPSWGETAMHWQSGYETAPAEGFAPTRMTQLSGKLPDELRGVLYRNGPAQFRYGSDTLDHWFDGDGMVHSIRFEDGEATHSGQFVQTTKRQAEQAAQQFLAPGFGSAGSPDFPVTGPDSANAANTSVLKVGDDLLALWEGGSAYRLDPVSLETRGPKTWRDDLRGMPFLAHPKVDPDGTIWNLATGGSRVGIYRISPESGLSDFGLVDIEAAAYIHDFAMTDRHILILVQPWIYDRMTPPFMQGMTWQPERGLRVLIVDKSDFKQTRWAELPPRFFFHTGGAWEDENGTIMMDLCAYQNTNFVKEGEQGVIQGTYTKSEADNARMIMATIPKKGEARLIETRLAAEFPVIDPRFQGQERRNVWMVDAKPRSYAPGAQAVRRLDWQTMTPDTYDYGPEYLVEEHVFVPRKGSSAEGDGWLVGTVLNMKESATEAHVFNALALSDGPVASFRAPYAWPLGFHGTWANT
jgi:carotenoid cleavage dioxygenase-like enzyme